MEITKNKTANFVLTNVALPIVLSVIVAVVYDKWKKRDQLKTKMASQPPKKVQETSDTEVTVTEV